MSKVSVIIPVYNVEAYLPKCIESVQNQTEKDIEIILVDDGSTDSCGEICDQYAEKDFRIKVIHQKNGGLGAARNSGLSVAQSLYVVFVDSDDYIEETLIEKALSTSEKFEADIVMYGYQKVSENGTVLYTYEFPDIFADDRAYSLKEKPEFLNTAPSACNKLFKKSLFEDILFPPRAWYEDLRTIPKLYPSAARIYCMRGYYPYYYFEREHSIMQNGNAEKTMRERIVAVNDLMDFYKNAGLYSRFMQELNWMYIFHGYFLLCREIMNLPGNVIPILRNLRKNLLTVLSDRSIQENRYLPTLSKREKFIFTLLYQEQYGLLKLFVKVNQRLKGKG